jgi:hypothetical protein
MEGEMFIRELKHRSLPTGKGEGWLGHDKVGKFKKD